MNAWKIKTIRHGETLIVAKTFDKAVEEFRKWHRAYLRKSSQHANEFRDAITSCECIGGIANA